MLTPIDFQQTLYRWKNVSVSLSTKNFITSQHIFCNDRFRDIIFTSVLLVTSIIEYNT